MNFMQATPRAQHKSNHFIWQAGAAMGFAALLVACGGGGDDAGAAPVAAPLPITRTEARAGDYFIYATTQTSTVPSGLPPHVNDLITTYRSIAADGTNQRVLTYSSMAAAQQITYDVNAALVDQDAFVAGSGVSCPYTPASQVAPPYPRFVGQAWSTTSVRTCGATTTTATQTGEIVAREQIVLPAGTFDSHRAERTALIVTGATTLSQRLTCWYSVERGVLLRCDYTNTSTTAPSTTPSNVSSSTQILTGLGGPARVAQGNVLSRFSGRWSVQYGGGASGSCNPLWVSASGAISGSCAATGGAPFAVTGSVAADGAVAITLPTGGVLSGVLTTPYSGSGTWTDGGLSGDWTAVHN